MRRIQKTWRSAELRKEVEFSAFISYLCLGEGRMLMDDRERDRVSRFVDRILGVNDQQNASLTFSVTEEEIREVINKCIPILQRQPIMVEVNSPMKVCGDIHGQFTDLLRIFNKCGYPTETSYLFLGDYVDRGKQQIEVIAVLMGYKVLYPESFFLLRGNHECSSINRTYGFYEECKRRYSVNLYNIFQSMFNWLPLCALVGGRIFGMHGGISPMLTNWELLDDSKIIRPLEPPSKCLASDLLWADPDPAVSGWAKNGRGVSFTFGEDVVREFCRKMDVDLIVRGHQVVQDGFEFFADRHLVTVFSAPRYCGEFDNAAAVMNVSGDMECSFTILKARTTPPKIISAARRRRSKAM